MLLALPVVLVIVLGWSRRWVGDDGFINFRVVDHILAGNGPVFNAGERVEITTSPLWLGILAASKLVTWWAPIEWVAVILGIACTAFGVFAAQRGSLLLDAAGRRAGSLAIPFGAVILVALPPFWDYASSALETGLAFAWLGGSWWLLTARLADRGKSRDWLAASICGLGPLIRPDLAVFAAAFVVLLIAWPARPDLRGRLVVLGSAAALPGLWQLFRMGYYGSLLPNTAFAKEASLARWDQGWRYFVDTIGTYWIFVPVAALLIFAVAPRAVAGRAEGRRLGIALRVAPVVAGLVHWVWVVRVGGDFMHARFILPGLFAIVLPAAALYVSRPVLPAGAVIGLWAVVVMALVRVSYPDVIGPDGIADERRAYTIFAGRSHPVTVEDYRDFVWIKYAREVERVDRSDESVLILGVGGLEGSKALRMPLAETGTPPVVAFSNVGMFSYTVGPRIHVVDELALGDVIAGRQRLVGRGRPGHEKRLDLAWVVARFGDPEATLPAGGPSPEAVEAARRALQCEPLAELLTAAGAPLTPRRFVSNLMLSIRTHDLRIPASPVAAAEVVCGPGR